MSWGSAAEFFAMGGYAPYVWGSFAVTALATIVEPLTVRARRRAALARLKRMNERTRSVRHEATA
jgi:heme exporter protein D